MCSLQEKLWAVLQATYTHSWNLARFVFAYKGLCALQSHVQGETYQVHSFLAAFIGALLVFRDNSNINSQVKTLPQDRGWAAGGVGGGRDVVQVEVKEVEVQGSVIHQSLCDLGKVTFSSVSLSVNQASGLLKFHRSQNSVCVLFSGTKIFFFF